MTRVKKSPPRWREKSGAGVLRAWSALSLGLEAAPAKLACFTLLSLVGGALPVLVGWLTKLVIDRLSERATESGLLALGLALAVAGILQAVLPHAVGYLQAEIGRDIGVLAQGRLFASLSRFTGLQRFEDPVFHDRLRLAKQSGRTAPFDVVSGTLGCLRACVTTGGFLGSLLALAPLMAAAVLISSVPVLVAELVLSRRRARLLWQISPRERREFFYDQLLSNVDAAKEIRLFGIGGFLMDRLQRERREANAATRRMDRRELTTQSALSLLAALVSGAGLLWAVISAVNGRLTLGDVAIFIAAVAGVQVSTAQFAGDFARAHHAVTLFTHYQAVIDAEPDLAQASRPHACDPLEHSIELRDVWFRYADDQPWVLEGVSLRIPMGSSAALVGLNGSGKSTLVKLLCRFYDPTRGAIMWDGVDIRDMDAAQLRHRLTAVFQDFMHYDLSAHENIALGDLEHLGDTGRVTDAARRAGAHETIAALPKGYDTLVTRMFFPDNDNEDADSSSGVLLSGGQFQRLALARGLIREGRDFLILDEPASGLDAQSEHAMNRSLQEFHHGRTSLLISHRLGSVREANRIFVLSEGRIVEEGDHASLMASHGVYAQLFTLQAAGYADELRPAAVTLDAS
ncbi:ABC transporter ATP-binding protein [Streptomyces fragilis]|uniref:ABC transporter ATP-binding protein n=1 Tax=Streptomyces fragilis TaxID=67301 RepID=A0ABV2YCU2_9ACTN|nr:ABC transporter ATP-binding protein [Streptomyces fragilis]